MFKNIFSKIFRKKEIHWTVFRPITPELQIRLLDKIYSLLKQEDVYLLKTILERVNYKQVKINKKLLDSINKIFIDNEIQLVNSITMIAVFHKNKIVFSEEKPLKTI